MTCAFSQGDFWARGDPPPIGVPYGKVLDDGRILYSEMKRREGSFKYCRSVST